MKKLISEDSDSPLCYEYKDNFYFWPAFWISHPDLINSTSPYGWIVHPQRVASPVVMAYKREFDLSGEKTVAIHVSADERYDLFLDGKRIGRGPERGDPENWFFETYELLLAPGKHILMARVWTLGYLAPVAQMSLQHGFILSADNEHSELLATGVADWKVKKLLGYSFKGENCTGSRINIEGSSFCWGFEEGKTANWQNAVSLRQGATKKILGNRDYTGHYLRPALLLAMLERKIQSASVRYAALAESSGLKHFPVDITRCEKEIMNNWDNFLKTSEKRVSLDIPPNKYLRIIIDLGDYYCVYPEIVVSRGANSVIDINWAESLFTEYSENGYRTPKGNRDVINGKYFIGPGDTFRPDGGKQRNFNTLWWRAGRYIELAIKTGKEPLRINDIILTETRYPIEMESKFQSDDERIENEIIPVCFRAFQMCSHETYMDCPYYEQLMYIADTRIQCLVQYVTSSDVKMPMKALELLQVSRCTSGLMQSRYPSWKPQVISLFPLLWIGMLYDFALWRANKGFVKKFLPVARNIIDVFILSLNKDNLLQSLPGWNFVDWVRSWTKGIPPGGDEGGISSIINYQFANALKMMIELEKYTGESEFVSRNKRIFKKITEAVDVVFWDETKGLYADDIQHKHFSEHAQALAVITEGIDKIKQERISKYLLHEPGLAECSVYFSHYLFEAFRILNLGDAIFNHLNLWKNMKEQGLKTVYEEHEPSRSDCHAWASHPIYHLFSSIAGIRPGSMGFESVEIMPFFGKLHQMKVAVPHHNGLIEMEMDKKDGNISGEIILPELTTGLFIYNNISQPLNSGLNFITI